MALYVGTNYHPHDWTPDRWDTDIRLMQEAGFSVVRMGHLCWDSYEPEDGVYTFEWFDDVMDRMAKAGIRVILDISMHPAPVWVHKKCPGCDIYGKSGNRMSSVRRYMEDVDDPAYQFYAHRFAETIVNRYKQHPALMGFGLCNELGEGFISYSPYALERFHGWLKKKYGTIDKLNRAWNTQRWCRKLTSFDDVFFPENEVQIGAPEPYLDMRRFFSDGIGEFISSLQEIVEKNAPGIPTSSNHCAEVTRLGFDYQKYADRFVDYPGIGFYPGFSGENGKDFIMSIYNRRLAETDRPMWCLEFQSGLADIYDFPPGEDRMYMMLALLHRAQMILGWTWRTMYGGEEQYYFGILDHDGEKNAKYDEYRRTAGDFKKLEPYAFPYVPVPEIGVAYHYDNGVIEQYASGQYRTPYDGVFVLVQRMLSLRNYDYNIIGLEDIRHPYKLILIPNHVMITEKMAENVREFVQNGGTVIMTGTSAVVDEHNTVYTTTHPGRLADVFGIRVGGFTRPAEGVDVRFGAEKVHAETAYYDRIELRGAEAFAVNEKDGSCFVSVNSYGKGKAYYIASETDTVLLGALFDRIKEEAGLKQPLPVPAGVEAAEIARGQAFYVNTTNREQKITLPYAESHGVLTGITYRESTVLGPYEAELFVEKAL